jgi:hypothetical protein
LLLRRPRPRLSQRKLPVLASSRLQRLRQAVFFFPATLRVTPSSVQAAAI